MAKIFRISLIISLIWLANSELLAAETFIGGHYWVVFTNKANSPYSVDRPHEFLSARAIERRLKQGIPVTDVDLPPTPAYIDSLRVDTEAKLWYQSRWFNGALVFTNVESSLQRIIDLPFVASVELVKPLPEPTLEHDDDFEVPVNKKVLEQGVQQIKVYDFFENILNKRILSAWESLYLGQDFGFSAPTIEQVNGQGLISQGYLGQGMTIVVLDAGFLAANQMAAFGHLWNNGLIKGTRDFVDLQQNIFGSSFHGSAVLSVMAAKRPGELFGTATEASYWLVRTEDAATEYRIEEYNWLVGAELADSLGADVINSSLGYTRFDDPIQNYTYSQLDGQTTVVARAANLAFERGILVVNSAGNYALQPWRYIGSPADSFGALSIGAVEISGDRATFSSFGPSADGRIKPDVMAHGRQVPVANTAGGISLANGTSFSSPVIAGLAAALWQKHPLATAANIKKAIIESGNRFLFPDTVFGHGIPDFSWASRLLKYNFQPEKHLVLFPNPIKPDSFVSFFSEKEQNVKIEIFDIRGQTVFVKDSIQVLRGYNRLQPFGNFLQFDNNIYFLRLIMLETGEHSVTKFIKAW